jgi:hypothetical protein
VIPGQCDTGLYKFWIKPRVQRAQLALEEFIGAFRRNEYVVLTVVRLFLHRGQYLRSLLFRRLGFYCSRLPVYGDLSRQFLAQGFRLVV